MSAALSSLNRKISTWVENNYHYTPVLGGARSVIALGTLLTLLCNPVNIFVPVFETGEVVNPLLNPIAPINKFNFFLLFDIENIYLMKWFAIFILGAVISGFYPQITCLFHWWISISFLYMSVAIDGGDHIAAILSLLLIPLCISDPRKNHWRSSSPSRKSPFNLLGILSIYLVRLQVAVIYLHAATGKFQNNEWMDGTAVYYWFNHSFFGMPSWLAFILNPILANSFIVTVLTYSVIILELALFAAIGMNTRMRQRLLPVALAFHFTIILVHGIFSFFFSIAAGLILYLYDTRKSFKHQVRREQLATEG